MRNFMLKHCSRNLFKIAESVLPPGFIKKDGVSIILRPWKFGIDFFNSHNFRENWNNLFKIAEFQQKIFV